MLWLLPRRGLGWGGFPASCKHARNHPSFWRSPPNCQLSSPRAEPASPGPAQVAQTMSVVRTDNPSVAGLHNTSAILPLQASRCIEAWRCGFHFQVVGSGMKRPTCDVESHEVAQRGELLIWNKKSSQSGLKKQQACDSKNLGVLEWNESTWSGLLVT